MEQDRWPRLNRQARIDIPAIMKIIAQYRFWGFQEPARGGYRDLKSPKADACVQCGKCEEKCTQHLHIMDEMEYAIRNLAYLCEDTTHAEIAMEE